MILPISGKVSSGVNMGHVVPYGPSSQPISLTSMTKCLDLGLNPGNDGNCIRLNIPPLTAERRKELAKLVSKLGEDGKVALRNVRRDALKSISKLEGISEDEIKFLEDGIDKLTSEHVKLVDEMVKQKEEDIANV